MPYKYEEIKPQLFTEEAQIILLVIGIRHPTSSPDQGPQRWGI